MSDVTGPARGTPVPAEVIPGLYWSVRESFVQYVLGNPDGAMTGDDGLETDGQGMFRFPLESASRTPEGWRIAFAGDVRFTAHFGMLSVAIVRPIVELTAEGGRLTVETGEGARMPIVTVMPAAPVDVEGRRLVFPPLDTTLAPEAVGMFGDTYPAGTPFDPLRIAIPSGEEEA